MENSKVPPSFLEKEAKKYVLPSPIKNSAGSQTFPILLRHFGKLNKSKYFNIQSEKKLKRGKKTWRAAF